VPFPGKSSQTQQIQNSDSGTFYANIVFISYYINIDQN